MDRVVTWRTRLALRCDIAKWAHFMTHVSAVRFLAFWLTGNTAAESIDANEVLFCERDV